MRSPAGPSSCSSHSLKPSPETTTPQVAAKRSFLGFDIKGCGWPWRRHRSQVLDNQLLNGQPGVSVAVCRSDEPRGMFGRAFLDGRLVRLLVCRPPLALVDISGVVLPVLLRPFETCGQARGFCSSLKMCSGTLTMVVPAWATVRSC